MTAIHKFFSGSGAARLSKALYIALLLCLTAAFIHPDLMETANHSYLLLDSVFSGRFFEFYNDIGVHANDLYYLNSANYNIMVYIVFALWELPMWLLNRVFSLPVDEPALWLWLNLLGVGLLFACAQRMGKLALHLEGEVEYSKVFWLFLLSPIPFLLTAFGFYDLPAVFLMLAALCRYAKGDIKGFSLLMGVSALFKAFALLLFVPLLLLARKRVLREWLPLGALAAAPYALTSLPFLGRSGNIGDFMDTMLLRLFDFSVGYLPLLPALLAALSVWCWLRPAPRTPGDRLRAAASCGLAVFGGLLLFVPWHPQWAVLVFPFYTLAAVSQRNRRLYELLSPVLSGCILLHAFAAFPRHLESNLLVWGALRLTGRGEFFNGQPPLISFMERLLPGATLSSAFAAVLLCVIVFHFDAGNGPLADRSVPEAQPVSLRRAALGFCLVIAFYLACLTLSFL